MTKRNLYGQEEQPSWLKFLSKYRYQVLGLIIIAILLIVIGGSHNPVELEGVYNL